MAIGNAAGSPPPGDNQALRALYDRYGPPVLHLATRLLGDGPDAEGIVRDTFTTAWAERSSYGPPDGTVLRWLLGTTLQVYADTYEQAGPGTPPPPDRKIMLRVVDELVVADEMARLTRDQQECLHLAIDQRRTTRQISALTGLDQDTVRAHLRHGFKELRRRLEVDGAPPEPGPSD